jgi:hypothetical protein
MVNKSLQVVGGHVSPWSRGQQGNPMPLRTGIFVVIKRFDLQNKTTIFWT